MTVLLAVLSPMLSPARVVVLDPFDAPAVTAPAAAVALTAVALGVAAVGLARRWAQMARSRRPAALLLSHAHVVAWAGLLVAVWLVSYPDASQGLLFYWPGITAYVLGNLTGTWATRNRPRTIPRAVRPPARDGDAVAWTGPFGRVIHRSWDQIGAVEVLDEELSSDSLLWARRFERRYVLRPGPALRLRQPEPHLPAITVSVDHAEQGAAVAARHLAERSRRD